MRISKRQLRKIIKEEKVRLAEQMRPEAPDAEELYDSLFQILDQELDKMGVDRYGLPEDAKNIAAALERIAGDVRAEGGVG